MKTQKNRSERDYFSRFLDEKPKKVRFWEYPLYIAGAAVVASIGIGFVGESISCLKNWGRLDEYIGEQKAKGLEREAISNEPNETECSHVSYRVNGQMVQGYLENNCNNDLGGEN